MSYEQAFAAYCVALQSLIDAGATVSLLILNHVVWIRSIRFDGRFVTVDGVLGTTNVPWSYSYRPDYINVSVLHSPLS